MPPIHQPPAQTSRFQPTQVTADDLNPEKMHPMQQSGWDGTDRRTNVRPHDDEPLTRGEFEKRIAGFRHYTAEAINNRFAMFEEKLLSRIEELDATLKSGFPNGDPDIHRKDHETKIRLDNEKAELYKSVREKVITSGVWGMFVLLAMAIWEYLKTNIQK